MNPTHHANRKPARFVPPVVIGLLFLAACQQTPAPRSAPAADAGLSAQAATNGKLAFSSDRDGTYDIYTMNPDGTGQARLTDDKAFEGDPAWSPDGSKLAFTSNPDFNNDVYVVNADGTGRTNLTDNPGQDAEPAWSPDGSKLAFTSLRDGNYDVYTMNADGTAQTRLTDDEAFEGEPAWSPDGSKIAFTRNPDLNSEIYVMNADGTGRTNLTNHLGQDAEPAWSPDGSKIAFTRISDLNNEIFVMNADGSGQTNLSNNLGYDAEPAWSPDGSKLAFSSFRDLNNEIYVMNTDGSGQTNLSNDEADDIEPAWGPAPSAVADDYLIDFESAPANRLLYSVRVGSGVIHEAGNDPKTATVPLVGKRRLNGSIAQGHTARVLNLYGSKRLVIASPNRNVPAPTGGRIKLTFTNFDPAGVTLTSLTLSNLTTDRAYLTFYYVDGSATRQPVPRTARGESVEVVPLNVSGIRAVDIYAPNAYAVDDVRFADEADE